MRPAGRIKMGYYPCPERVVDMVASHIVMPTENKVALVDPCAGEGIAIMRLREKLGAQRVYVHGVEQSPDRAAICREKPFDAFVKGNSIVGIEWAKQQYDIIWFNPPYDTDKENKREELLFYTTLIRDRRLLKIGGVFIGILKRDQIKVMGKALLNWLDGPIGNTKAHNVPDVYVFPDPEYDEFEQVVVLGTFRKRARGNVGSDMLEAFIQEVESDECPVLDFAEMPTWKPTHYDGSLKPVAPVSILFDPLATARLAEDKGWIARSEFSDALYGRRIDRVQTLLPLNSAHQAAAITAGFLNGKVIDARPEGGDRQMVKGRTVKRLVVTSNKEKQPDGTYKHVEIETFASEVWSLTDDGFWHVYRIKEKKDETQNGPQTQSAVIEGDLLTWMESIEDGLKRTITKLFPPILTQQVLDSYDITQLYTPHRKPAGKQKHLIRAIRHQIDAKQPGLVIVQMGGGKSYIAGSGLREKMEAAWAKGERFRSIIICDKHMLVKWRRELEEAIPGVKVCLVEHIDDIDPNKPRIRAAKPIRKGRMSEKTYRHLIRKWENPHPLDTDIFLMAYTDISLSANKQIAVQTRPLWAKNSWGLYKPVEKQPLEIDPATKKPKLHIITKCPTCGAIQRKSEKDGTYTYDTLASIDKSFPKCQRPLTRLKLDPRGSIVRTSETYDENGALIPVVRRYSIELVTDKHGNPLKCNTPLWSYVANNANVQPDMRTWTTAQRALHERHVDEYRTKLTKGDKGGFGNPVTYELEDWKGKLTISRKGTRKIDMATYLQRFWRFPSTRDENGRIQPGELIPIEVVIVDEMHKAKSAGTARGMAAANIGALARRSVIGLTGTVTGGYSSTMFYLLWRFTPLIRRYFKYGEVFRFVKRYGALSYTRKAKDPHDLEDGSSGRRSRRRDDVTVKEISGMSPEAYLLFWQYSVFAELAEIFRHLPDYRDIVQKVDLDDVYTTVWRIPILNSDEEHKRDENGDLMYEEKVFTQKTAYEYVRSRLEREAKALLARGDKGLLAAMLQTLLVQPDLSGDEIKIIHPRDKSLVVEFPGLRDDILYPKEERVLEQLVKDKKAGHKSIVFVSHTKTHDVQRRWEWVMAQAEAKYGVTLQVASMRSEEVDAVDREEWIDEQLKGSETEPPIDILLCNPKLIETGLDLVAFSRTHFIEIDYSIFTMAQAARRTYRPQQTKDVEVYYWVYNGTAEMPAMAVVASKKKETAKVQGSSLSEALIAEAGAFNLQEMLAQELARGFSTTALFAEDDSIQRTLDEAKRVEDASRARLIAEMDASELGETAIESIDPTNGDSVLDGLAPTDDDLFADIAMFDEDMFKDIMELDEDFFGSSPAPDTTIKTVQRPTWEELRAQVDAKKPKKAA